MILDLSTGNYCLYYDLGYAEVNRGLNLIFDDIIFYVSKKHNDIISGEKQKDEFIMSSIKKDNIFSDEKQRNEFLPDTKKKGDILPDEKRGGSRT